MTLAAGGVFIFVVVSGPVAGMAMAATAGALGMAEAVDEMAAARAARAETQSVVAIGTPVVMAVDRDVVVGIPADLMVFE